MRLAELVRHLDSRYDPRWAEPWDAVGLVCGDPEATVDRVHLAVDPVAAVADEAVTVGAQLLVTHHPLYLGGTTTVAATSAKGRLVHRLITAGVALYVAHTNADVATPGVSDALGAALSLRELRPLQPAPEHGGLGRVGELPTATTLGEFTRQVAVALPATTWGVRAAGDPRRPVRTVAVCGGSGGSLAAAALAAGADVLVTADLKHHATAETVDDGGVALVDAAHWATEWPWLAVAAGAMPTTVETTVSAIVTDPWTMHEHPLPHPTEAGS